MKKILLFICLTSWGLHSSAQVKLDDFGRIVLNVYLPDSILLPTEAKSMLLTKLNQIANKNGIGGSQANPRFIITASANVGTKDIIAGPPQMFAEDIAVTFFIGDAFSNTVFANTTLNIKGVGTNENKAIIDAFKNISPKNKDLLSLLEEGKTKIINFYATQCDFILKKSNSLAEQFKFEDAIHELMMVPETSKDCYFKSQDEANKIFKKKIESDCTEKVKQAKLIWASENTEAGAIKASEIMISIIPSENCGLEINKLTDEIKTKLQADEQKKFEFNMLEMQKRYDTYQKKLDLRNQVLIEYIRAKRQTVIYNKIYW